MESPAVPATVPGQQVLSRPAATAGELPAAALRRRGIFRHPVARQLVRFAGVGVVCTAASLALYAFLRPWIGPNRPTRRP